MLKRFEQRKLGKLRFISSIPSHIPCRKITRMTTPRE